MTDLERMIKFFLRDIYVSIPCEIVKLDQNSMYANVEPLIYDNIELPIIPSVPILFIGNNQKKLKFKNGVGDIVTVFFTQMDLSRYLAKELTGQVETKERFNLTNAFALPFNLHPKSKNEQMPQMDFEIIGDIKIQGNIEVEGDITQSGNQNITGSLSATETISSDVDCLSAGISGKGHSHSYTWEHPGGTRDTMPPK